MYHADGLIVIVYSLFVPLYFENIMTVFCHYKSALYVYCTQYTKELYLEKLELMNSSTF